MAAGRRSAFASFVTGELRGVLSLSMSTENPIPISDLFEAHLTVSELNRAVVFYRDLLRFPLARVFPERKVAFFWIGASGKAMLGLWEPCR